MHPRECIVSQRHNRRPRDRPRGCSFACPRRYTRTPDLSHSPGRCDSLRTHSWRTRYSRRSARSRRNVRTAEHCSRSRGGSSPSSTCWALCPSRRWWVAHRDPATRDVAGTPASRRSLARACSHRWRARLHPERVCSHRKGRRPPTCPSCSLHWRCCFLLPDPQSHRCQRCWADPESTNAGARHQRWPVSPWTVVERCLGSRRWRRLPLRVHKAAS
jgi:hypothetical protein